MHAWTSAESEDRKEEIKGNEKKERNHIRSPVRCTHRKMRPKMHNMNWAVDYFEVEDILTWILLNLNLTSLRDFRNSRHGTQFLTDIFNPIIDFYGTQYINQRKCSGDDILKLLHAKVNLVALPDSNYKSPLWWLPLPFLVTLEPKQVLTKGNQSLAQLPIKQWIHGDSYSGTLTQIHCQYLIFVYFTFQRDTTAIRE